MQDEEGGDYLAKRPRAIFILEAFAVFGIFTLYALEFAGIDTFSALLPDDHPLKQNEIPLSLLSLGDTDTAPISVKGSTLVIGLVLIGGAVFFIVIRRRK